MYRILSASKSTYVTNKIIAGRRMTTSNVGQAGTMDLFKLYDETYISGVAEPVELSRLLIQFDYSALAALTSSVLDISSPDFTVLLNMKDVYGGQTVPSNFTVNLLPLSKSWNQGRGHDVVSFRDIDAANWLTASLSPTVTWSQEGAGASGSLGDDVDVIVSGSLFGAPVQALGASQLFARGDEDLLIDVTTLVSATMAGGLANNGFRLSFSDSDEQDQITRFVKRFGSTNTFNKNLRPRLIVKYPNEITSSGNKPFFDTLEPMFVYNVVNGINQNFFSGSVELTGNNVLSLQLVASKSIQYVTTSWSPSHSASINHVTRSFVYMSRSFSGSQYNIGTNPQPGIYFANVNLSTVTDSEIRDFVGNAETLEFRTTWYSADGTLQLANKWIKFHKRQGSFANADTQNLIINIVNLQDKYSAGDSTRLKVFATNIREDMIAFKVPTQLPSVIVPDMRWQIRNAFTRDIVIPFDNATKLSNDFDGMYFDLYFNDLDVNQVYEIEFLIKNNFSRDLLVSNQGFRFKVTP